MNSYYHILVEFEVGNSNETVIETGIGESDLIQRIIGAGTMQVMRDSIVEKPSYKNMRSEKLPS